MKERISKLVVEYMKLRNELEQRERKLEAKIESNPSVAPFRANSVQIADKQHF
jgi:hypothetical protein